MVIKRTVHLHCSIKQYEMAKEKVALKKKYSAKEYAEKKGLSKSRVLQLLREITMFNAPMPTDIKEVSMVGNSYVITLKD